MNMNELPVRVFSVEAEQAVIGSLLLSNDAIDRIGELKAAHFYRADHREIFAEIVRQIVAGKPCDVVSLLDPLRDKVDQCAIYCHSMAESVASAANIKRHADMVIEYATRREIMALCDESREMAGGAQSADAVLDSMATRIDALAQKKVSSMPVRLSDSLADYIDVITARMEGRIKPIATGFVDLDARLDGGLERGTLTVIAARPGMGKSAMGLALGRNVAEWGSAAFLSMEMSKSQVNDRNVAALGKLPISWLRKPAEQDAENWARFTNAVTKANELNFYIDDETSLNMLAIRNKARYIKRKAGLDLLIIDQLSFIAGSNAENKAYEIGEYTRGMLALAKEMNIAIVLLAQLNRDCEKRQNRRPILSDLSSSGSIEQDAANVIFLYRDEIYNPDSRDKGICEVITAKQRQGETGMVGLSYIGPQTRFEDLQRGWQPAPMLTQRSRGFD
jgi:replicative DNA helicase